MPQTQITLAQAQKMIELAVSRARELQAEVAIAVVDSAGNPITLARMDGASFPSTEIAWGKAWTAAAFLAPSAAVAERFADAPGFMAAISSGVNRRFTPRQGAVNFPGGAVGVSGTTSAQDEDIASAALAALDGSR